MADEFVPFPEEQGWQIDSVLPFAQRPIPYANALQPQLAIPGMIREPINAIASMLQIPGEAARGELGQSPEELMGPALKVAEGMLTTGLASPGFTIEAVEHDPFAVSEEGGRVSRALLAQQGAEDARLGLGSASQSAADAAAWQAKIDKMIAEGKFERIEHNPFAEGGS